MLIALSEDSDECVDVIALGEKVKAAAGNRHERRLRIGCRDKKKVGQVVVKLNLDVVAGQESWERDGFTVNVDGYKWIGKLRQA